MRQEGEYIRMRFFFLLSRLCFRRKRFSRKTGVHLHRFPQITGQQQVAIPHQKEDGGKRGQQHHPEQYGEKAGYVEPAANQPGVLGPGAYGYQQKELQQVEQIFA